MADYKLTERIYQELRTSGYGQDEAEDIVKIISKLLSSVETTEKLEREIKVIILKSNEKQPLSDLHVYTSDDLTSELLSLYKTHVLSQVEKARKEERDLIFTYLDNDLPEYADELRRALKGEAKQEYPEPTDKEWGNS